MFEQFDLHAKLTRAVTDMGLSKPTSVQTMAIPPAMEGKDILASAPTGTGKTLAFLLPACQYLLDFPRKEPGSARVLILTPTRELAEQVYEQAKAVVAHTRLSVGLITGGINYGTDRETLSQSLDVLVATPGRLFEHIEKESFDCREIETLILDEADRMLDMGFGTIVNQIAAEARWRKQSMLFSATLEGAGIDSFANRVLTEPEQIEATPSRKEKGKTHEFFYLADTLAHKQELLLHHLEQAELSSAIVFVKTRERVMEMAGKLTQAGVKCCWLQGEMPQDKRQGAIRSFKQGESKVLIATDVAARGIDVADVSHVINFDMPRTADVYVHRIGRTARAGKKGTAISLVEAHDFSMLERIQRFTKNPIKRRVVESLKPKHKTPAKPSKKKKAGVKKKSIRKAKKK